MELECDVRRRSLDVDLADGAHLAHLRLGQPQQRRYSPHNVLVRLGQLACLTLGIRELQISNPQNSREDLEDPLG